MGTSVKSAEVFSEKSPKILQVLYRKEKRLEERLRTVGSRVDDRQHPDGDGGDGPRRLARVSAVLGLHGGEPIQLLHLGLRSRWRGVARVPDLRQLHALERSPARPLHVPGLLLGLSESGEQSRPSGHDHLAGLDLERLRWDAGGTLFAETQDAAQVSTTLEGYATFDGSTVGVYDLSFTFAQTFAAVAGTTYWISPFSTQLTFNPIVSWMSGEGGDGSSYQTVLGPGEVVTAGGPKDGDRAFALYAASVPEPSSLTLCAIAVLIGLGCGWSRSRKMNGH